MMTRDEFRTIANNGVWKQNTSIAQILGLCPLLAVTTNAVNGIMLSLATILVMALSNVAVASLRNFIPHEIRIPVFILIVAALVTVVDLLFNANLHELYLVLGIFIPLITTNCIILGRAEAFAAKNSVLHASFDGLMMGAGFGLVMLAIGTVRELLGTGAILGNMHLLFGPIAAHWQLTLFSDYSGFLLAILPPGAFLVLGLLIALKNVLDERAAEKAKATAAAPAPATSRRVRVTGVIE